MSEDNELYEIDKHTAREYAIVGIFGGGHGIACTRHGDNPLEFPSTIVRTVWDALEAIEEHEREQHMATGALFPKPAAHRLPVVAAVPAAPALECLCTGGPVHVEQGCPPPHPGAVEVAPGLGYDARVIPTITERCSNNWHRSAPARAGQLCPECPVPADPNSPNALAARGMYCQHCDVYVGFGAAGVVVPPADRLKDNEWLATHCWMCEKSAAQIATEARA